MLMRTTTPLLAAGALLLAACATAPRGQAPAWAALPADTARVYETSEVQTKALLLNGEEVLKAIYRHYPPELQEQGWEGGVLIRAVIDENGVIRNRTLARRSGHREVDEAALSVLRVMKFRPAEREGKRVRTSVDLPISFAPGS
jgi:TonB family protein